MIPHCTIGAPYQSGISKATSIYPDLRYLHYIFSQTLAGKQTTPVNVTMLDATLLSHIYKGLSVEMGQIIARIASNFATDLRKQSLGLQPFITRIAHYLKLDIVGSNLTEVLRPPFLQTSLFFRTWGWGIEMRRVTTPSAQSKFSRSSPLQDRRASRHNYLSCHLFHKPPLSGT